MQHVFAALSTASLLAWATQGLAQDDHLGEDLPPESRFTIEFGVDVTSAYYCRGFLYEDSGLITQPYADVSLEVYRGQSTTLLALMGTWNSIHSEATDAGTTDSFLKDWYESDIYTGLGAEHGPWYFEALYYLYTSPSDAWSTIEELYLSAALDDSEHMGHMALQPSVLIAIETGDNANDGGRPGTYLELAISPGYAIEDGPLEGVEICFPASVGFSLSNYYEGDNGENDVFGFASVGTSICIPLALDDSWGSWSISAGIEVLFLGDAASTYNDDNETEAIFTAGISAEF